MRDAETFGRRRDGDRAKIRSWIAKICVLPVFDENRIEFPFYSVHNIQKSVVMNRVGRETQTETETETETDLGTNLGGARPVRSAEPYASL